MALLLPAVAPAETLQQEQGTILEIHCRMTPPQKAAGPHVFSR